MFDETPYIVREGPIYKYASIDAVKAILENQTLRFTQPEEFNDPFDCNRNILKFSYTKSAEDEYKKALDHPEYSKFTRKQKRQSLTKFRKDPVFFQNAYMAVAESFITKSTVTCFSEHFSNTLMWSHYAEKHTGVCLEFKATKDRSAILEGVEVNLIANVNYDRTDIIDYNRDTREAVLELFTRKSKDWKYEKEVRMVLIDQKDRIIKFKKDFLTGIIFGCRIDTHDKEAILNIIANKGYEIKQTEAIRGRLELEFRNV